MEEEPEKENWTHVTYRLMMLPQQYLAVLARPFQHPANQSNKPDQAIKAVAKRYPGPE